MVLNQKCKFMNIFTKFILVILTLTLVNGCSGFFKRSDVKDNPVNVKDRVRKNIEEGKGVRFNLGKRKGGVFDFASANELWRASVETLDFVPLVLRILATSNCIRGKHNSKFGIKMFWIRVCTRFRKNIFKTLDSNISSFFFFNTG